MAVPEITIEMFQGEDRTTDFRVTPVEDITGWTIDGFVQLSDSILALDGDVVDGPKGKYSVTIDRADTASEEAGEFEFEIWRTDTDENVVLAVGTLILKDAIRP